MHDKNCNSYSKSNIYDRIKINLNKKKVFRKYFIQIII